MKKVKFVIEDGSIDALGNKVSIDGMQVPNKKVLLTRDFDVTKPIGRCDVFKEDGLLKAEAEIPDELIDAYPAISFKILDFEAGDDGLMNITDARLSGVSLCWRPNTNPSIKKISEQ